MVRHYGRNFEYSSLHFYAMIESRYGGNRFTVVVREWNGNFLMVPTVYSSTLAVPVLM